MKKTIMVSALALLLALLGACGTAPTLTPENLYTHCFEKSLDEACQWAGLDPAQADILPGTNDRQTVTFAQAAVLDGQPADLILGLESGQIIQISIQSVYPLGEDAVESDLEDCFNQWKNLTEWAKKTYGTAPGRLNSPDRIQTYDDFSQKLHDFGGAGYNHDVRMDASSQNAQVLMQVDFSVHPGQCVIVRVFYYFNRPLFSGGQ